MDKKREFFSSFFTSSKKSFGIVFLLVLAIAIPVTLGLVKQQQDIRQHAAGNFTCSLSTWTVSPSSSNGACKTGQYCVQFGVNYTGTYASPVGQTWNFGDGSSTGYNNSSSQTYRGYDYGNSKRNVTVSLFAQDNNGSGSNTASCSKSIEIPAKQADPTPTTNFGPGITTCGSIGKRVCSNGWVCCSDIYCTTGCEAAPAQSAPTATKSPTRTPTKPPSGGAGGACKVTATYLAPSTVKVYHNPDNADTFFGGKKMDYNRVVYKLFNAGTGALPYQAHQVINFGTPTQPSGEFNNVAAGTYRATVEYYSTEALPAIYCNEALVTVPGSATNTPTRTPTRTPIPTTTVPGGGTTLTPSTTIPGGGTSTLTPSTSPTGSQGDMTLAVSATLPGIGSAQGNNNSPKNTTRPANIQILNNTNEIVKEASVNLNYANGTYKGTASLSGVAAGSYTIKIKMENTLYTRISGIVNLKLGANTLNSVMLIPGDLNGDNILDMRDHSIFVKCYQGECNEKGLADFDDDGKLSGFDYNILIRSFAIRQGD